MHGQPTWELLRPDPSAKTAVKNIETPRPWNFPSKQTGSHIKVPESNRRQEAPEIDFFFIGHTCATHQGGSFGLLWGRI